MMRLTLTPFGRIGNRPEKRQIVSFSKENRLTTVPAIDHMIDQTISNRAKWSSHARKLAEKWPIVNRK